MQLQQDKRSNISTRFNEYLAGIIDGDGSLLLSPQGYGSLEITMDSRDERCLQYIKNKLGEGSVKKRSGSKSVRYRLHNKLGIINLINRINGLIRYSNRLAQLEKLCNHYNIEMKKYHERDIFTKKSSYFAGLFDSDGTLTMSLKRPKHSKLERPQLTISVTSKNKSDLEIWLKEFNGNIYIDQSTRSQRENKRSRSSKLGSIPTNWGKVSYKWSIQKKEDILNLLNYLKDHPLHTLKQQRVLMIEEYFRLYELHAFKSDNTILYKSFQEWIQKWKKYGLERDANLCKPYGHTR